MNNQQLQEELRTFEEHYSHNPLIEELREQILTERVSSTGLSLWLEGKYYDVDVLEEIDGHFNLGAELKTEGLNNEDYLDGNLTNYGQL